MPVPGLSLLGLKRIRGFVSILRYINPTIIIIIIIIWSLLLLYFVLAKSKFMVTGYLGVKNLNPIVFKINLKNSQKKYPGMS